MLLCQSGGSLSFHPIFIAKVELDRYFEVATLHYFLDGSLWRQGPFEQLVETSLAASFQLDHLLQVCLPGRLLLLSQLQSALQHSVHKSLPEKAIVHHPARPYLHSIHFRSNAVESSPSERRIFQFPFVFLFCDFSAAGGREQDQPSD